MSVVMSPADIRALAAKAGPDSVLHELVKKMPRAKSRDLEHIEQVKLFEWAKDTEEKIPALKLLFAIPNFAGRLGKKTVRHGARLKAEGRRRGVPDLMLAVSRNDYHGLFIELKSLEGSPTKEQIQWLVALQSQGYCAEVCRGFESARDLILDYLGIGELAGSPLIAP